MLNLCIGNFINVVLQHLYTFKRSYDQLILLRCTSSIAEVFGGILWPNTAKFLRIMVKYES